MDLAPVADELRRGALPSSYNALGLMTSNEGVATEIHEVLVRDEGMANNLKFRGSPTIRINGRDVAGESLKAQSFALSCRLYSGSESAGLPPVEMIHRAVIEARQGDRP